MAYNQNLARDIELQLRILQIPYVSKKMFGGICYLVNGNMLVGVIKDDLALRLGKELTKQVILEPNVRVMDFTKRVMHGYAMLNYDYVDDTLLNRYISLCLSYVSTLPRK